MKLLFSLVPALLLLTACPSSRHATTTTSATTVDSTAYYRQQIATLTLERDQFERRVDELEYLALTFVDCPDLDSLRAAVLASGCRNIDSVLRVLDSYRSEVKRYADGSLEIRGQLARVVQSKSKVEEESRLKDKKIAELRDSMAAKKVEVVEKWREREVEKTSLWWVWLLPVCVALGAWLRGVLMDYAERLSDKRAQRQ